MNVKVNDNVLVIVGRKESEGGDKGKQGKVLSVSPKANKITVEGVRIQKKHQKARKANDTSKIVEIPGPIDASNVMVICPACGKPTKVKHAFVDGKKVRICGNVVDSKACGAVLDKAYSKKASAKAAAAAEEAPKKRTRKRAAKAAAPEAAEQPEAKKDDAGTTENN